MHFVTMYPIPRQIAAINADQDQPFHDSKSTNIISSTTEDSTVSMRSAAEHISRLLLIFVPSTSRRIHSIDNETHPGAKSPSVILSTFFNFSYHLCFSPFKFVLTEDGLYTIHKFLPQQVLCVLISISSIIIRLAEFRESWPTKPHESWNPVSYFRVSNALSNLTFHAVILMTLWVHNDRLLEILNFFQRPKSAYLMKKSWSIKAPSLTVIFCILNAVVGSACFFFGTDVLANSSWHPEHLYKCMLHRAKYSLFLHDQPNCGYSESLLEVSKMDAIDHSLAIIFGTSLYFRRINGLYEELFILAGAFTFWLSANAFSQSLDDRTSANLIERRERENRWPSVYEKYSQLTELSDLINNAYGPVYFVFTITSIFYYSINLDNLLVSDDVLVRAKFMAFYSGLILTYLLSADICRQIGYLEIWISKHLDEISMSELSHKQLSLILHEIATTRVGMTGCHLFTITYSMVAQLAFVLITYFIISVQYRET